MRSISVCKQNLLSTIFLSFSLAMHNSCPFEQSIVTNSPIKVNWTSEKNAMNEIIISQPPCLRDHKLITRICINGFWHPQIPPLCQKTTDTLNSTKSMFSCPKNCAKSQMKCFCKSDTCQNLATVANLHERKIVEGLVGEEVCQLGQIAPGIPSYMNGTIWQFGRVKTGCKICEKKATKFLTRLVLTFETKNTSLYLLVYHQEGVKKYKEDKHAIFCFTNSGKYQVQERTKISKIYENNPSLLVFKIKLRKLVGEYWCLGFTPNHTILNSNKIIAWRKKPGNEYSLRFTLHNPPKLNKIIDEKLKILNSEIRLMEIYNSDNHSLDILVHISTNQKREIEPEFRDLATKIHNTSLNVTFFRNCEFCLFPLTKRNTAVAEFCLLRDSTPKTRRCNGDFLLGAVWGDPPRGECTEPDSPTTRKLRDLAQTPEIPGENLWEFIRNASLGVLDIYYLDLILEKIHGFLAFNIVDKLMGSDRGVLQKSQHVLNSTDVTLELLEEILTSARFDPHSVQIFRQKNLLVHVANPFLTNISGFLMGKNHEIRGLRRGEDFTHFGDSDLDLGVHIPEQILDQIHNETNNVSDVFVIIVVFFHDNLFLEDDFYQSDSFVISVTIPGHGAYLKTPISIAFSPKVATEGTFCGFWDLGTSGNWKKGEWSQLGGEFSGNLGNLQICSYLHLTHFALLLMSDKSNYDEDNVIISDDDHNDLILEIITIFGCSLSLFGILGVFLTAICHTQWCQKTGTKILLNLCLAILLESICIQLSEINPLKTQPNLCKIIGMTLHYVVLSKFTWMLIYAFLQYYRFVKVIGVIPQNLILKSVIVGWGVPLVLVFLVGLTTDQSYVSKSYELCYPRGLLLYFGVLVPICAIIVANIAIFCVIMYNISHTVGGNRKLFKPRLYLALLLFSVLGIPWVFGLVAEVLSPSILKIVLFYVFCVTATLQGFVLFLFYVVLNRETRHFWLRKFGMIKK
ncbi:adhesion G-protein coupled receptor G6-like [Tribolium madens]|uniref:adhesion G-protein coupled receptor G6-like n=1 Tax=Tribolium madens TaxID=41895 RepID=UPI001CF75411|nr:adhesion G-protein coupled receptor G6-like [Tribolium madens]